MMFNSGGLLPTALLYMAVIPVTRRSEYKGGQGVYWTIFMSRLQ